MPLIQDIEDCALEPIAIVGMACRLPGSVDSPSSLWEKLEKKTSVQTPRVPESRFNIDAYIHQNLERPGSFNVPGGYFLDGPLENFDPTFFNMTPVEAMWLDPQQRKMVEVCYECLESAGKTLDAVAGSNTAVFVGSFTSDYQQMSIREPDFRHNYAATGVDPGIISNRIGNIFNLRGPSFTINTACSSSIYAIHNACHALRARDCEAAITGGVNLILTVDQHMNTAKLGILSPTSTCHTFDASADGYGRAEGVGALYLKRLSDAIRDGDVIRGVIRSSAVNTNGKVPGMGITHPSVKGQELVVRAAYERARLNPNNTAYLECHGTGTPVGDPIEVRAVSNAMNDTRPTDKPLLVGAIKANIGHSEAASGIFAVMKAAMMTEKGVIPGVCGLKNINPAIHEKEWNVKVQADTIPWPKHSPLRRASVSSFGYGGTNGHVIIESINSLFPLYQHGQPKAVAAYDHSSPRPFLVTFSGHDKTTLTRNIAAHAAVAARYYLADLTHTLNTRRTRFATRAFAVAHEGRGAEDLSADSVQVGTAPAAAPQLAFIFTGQGAQWARMGAAAMAMFPEFVDAIRALDRVLRRLPDAPAWTLEDALLALPAASRVNDAEVAQPVCTAVQIALVDLLAAWGVAPATVVGHSSGEIAAAYAAGLMSAPEAMLAAFFRGREVQRRSPAGAMLAVGLGADEVAPYVEGVADVVVACENSPASVTLSGTAAGIEAMKARLDEKGVFARALRTGRAYHSPQMDAVAPHYDAALAAAVRGLDEGSREWRVPRRARMFSSVTGEEITSGTLGAEYWSRNLRSRVRFDSAVTALCTADGLDSATTFVEVGPHAALAGPFRQICHVRGLSGRSHVATLVRGADCGEQLLRTAGALFLAGYPVDLEAVNAAPTLGAAGKQGRPFVLVDLPPYQWNYQKVFWAEPRLSAEARKQKYPRHDLLGRRQLGDSDNCLIWRNVLRRRDVPWLVDHTLGEAAVFPAAGHLSAAIEGLRQICEQEGTDVGSVTLRDVAIRTALVIPDDDDGIEVQFRLQKLAKDGSAPAPTWYSFAVESLKDGHWTVHSEGKLAANFRTPHPGPGSNGPVSPEQLPQRVSGKTWYQAFERVGFQYGPSFQRLGSVRTNPQVQHAAAGVGIVTESGLMDGESRYVLHPSTIDACLQLIIVSIHVGKHKSMPWGVVPIDVEETTLWFPGAAAGSEGHAVAWTDDRDGRYFNTHTRLFAPGGDMVLDIRGLRCVAYEAAVPVDARPQLPRQPYVEEIWKPDITTLAAKEAKEIFPGVENGLDATVKAVELINHRSPVTKAVVLAKEPVDILRGIRQVLPEDCSISVGHSTGEVPNEVEAPTLDLAEDSFDLASAGVAEADLIVLGQDVLSATQMHEILIGSKSALSAKGTLVVACNPGQGDAVQSALAASGFSTPRPVFALPSSTVILATPQAPEKTTATTVPQDITIVTPNSASPLIASIAAALSALEIAPTIISPADVSSTLTTATSFIVDDTSSLLLSPSESTFDALRAIATASNNPTIWLTAGATSGANPAAATARGFLRVARSENAAARITLLDLDDADADANTAAAVVAEKLGAVPTKDEGADTEFWLRGGILHCARLVPNAALNAEFNADAGSVEEGVLRAGAELQGRVDDGGRLVFEDAGDRGDDPAGVPVQVACAQLDAAPDAFGVVAGTRVDDEDEVVAFAPPAQRLRTVSRVPERLVQRLHGLAARDVVASLPGVAEVVHVLCDAAGVRKGMSVLAVRPSTRFLLAAAGLSAAVGFNLAVVASSEKERDQYAATVPDWVAVVVGADVAQLSAQLTDQPSVIVAEEMTPLVQELWRSIPAGGRLALNGGSMTEAPDLVPFRRGASFHSVSLPGLARNNTSALGELLQRSLELVVQHKDTLLLQGHAYDVGLVGGETAEVPANAVLSYAYGKSIVKILKQPQRLQFSPDATYLLVGALGGLGRSLASWMLQRGARHFAFLSRSGADKPEAAAVVQSIEAAGATARVFRADAADADAVRDAVDQLQSERPVKGVVHAAMVLQDAMLARMAHAQYLAALQPKVLGALNLHAALQAAGADLDFFLLTSSISATLGNPGQANYAAANAFLDALALHRATRGLPAASLALPMVLDVGVVAQTDGLEEALTRKGMYGIDEVEMLRAFETGMAKRSGAGGRGAANVVLGLEPARLADAAAVAEDAYWRNDARLAALRATVDRLAEASLGGGGGAEAGFAARLKAAAAEGTDAVVGAVCEHVMQRCAAILLRSVDEFEAEGASIASYGLDSMIGSQLRNWLFREFGLDVPFQDLLAPTLTFRKLAVDVAKKLGVVE